MRLFTVVYENFNFIVVCAHHIARAEFILHEWKFSVDMDCIQQQNSDDCGIHVIANACSFILETGFRNIIAKQVTFWGIETLLSSSPNEHKTNNRCDVLSNSAVEQICGFVRLQCRAFHHLTIQLYGATFQQIISETVKASKMDTEWTVCASSNCYIDSLHEEEQFLCVGCRKWYHENCIVSDTTGKFFQCDKYKRI
ncbi:Uncharacterised protein at_DN1771 [Pycnogonum litorale]